MTFSLRRFMETAGAGIQPSSVRLKDINSEEFELLYALYTTPQNKLRAGDLTEIMKSKLKKDFLEINVLETLRRNRFWDYRERAEKIEELASIAKQMYEIGNHPNESPMPSTLRTKLDRIFEKEKLYSRIVLLGFFLCFEDRDPGYLPTLRHLSAGQSVMMLQRLSRILRIHEPTAPQDAASPEPPKEEEPNAAAESAEQIERLKSKIIDYEKYLHEKELEIDQLHEQLEKAKLESTGDAQLIARIGQQGILDYFYKAAMLRNKYRREKVEIPDDMQSVLVTIASFLKVMQELGLTPIHEIGDELQIREEDAAKFEFELDFAQKFDQSVDTKTIKIITPGWAFRNETIIRPKAQEM